MTYDQGVMMEDGILGMVGEVGFVGCVHRLSTYLCFACRLWLSYRLPRTSHVPFQFIN